MKKAAFLLIGGLLTIASAQAQINWGDYSQSFADKSRENPSTVGLILAVRKENNSFWEIRETSKHVHTLEQDASFRRLRPAKILARTTFDTARAQFFLEGAGPANAHLFQFRVTEYPSNRILVPWHSLNQFTDSTLIHQSGLPRMAYLGGYRTGLGSMLIMDVRKTATDQIVATSMVTWESIKPVITNIYTSENFDKFLKKLQSPWLPDNQPVGAMPPVLNVSSTNTNLVFLLENGHFRKEQIQYELIRNGSVYTPWRYNEYDNNIVWIKNYPPGNYVIKIRYSAQPQHIAEYRFDVAPVWYQTNLFRIIAGIFVAALLGACLFLLLYIGQRRKTRQEEFTKNRLQLELKAIYAQLNPHFVFNALSSIQGLINKQDIQGANSYLSDFGRLMRESLKHSHQDELSLHEETQTLDTYLKLEQLRFGFQYKITVDPAINVYETDIPLLLLQPLVENAVKHGVASLQEKGYIDVNVSRSDDAMIITITDNGKGFADDQITPGLGLKLTRDRIDLLNKLRSECPIALSIRHSSPAGTQLILTFNHWF